jgi:hypothetical protein
MSMRVTRTPGYTLQLETGAAALSPPDGVTYYFGCFTPLGASATSGQRRVYIPKPGVITAAYGYVLVSGTLGSNEAVTFSVRKNNTTDYLISNTATMDAISNTFSKTALNAPVAAGDFIEVKMVAPTWVTNPTTVRMSVIVIVS